MNPSVFFDVYQDRESKGIVSIRLEGDTSHRDQFFQLCIGQNGFSYRNTSFFSISNLGKPGELIHGGDYEHNNGSGGGSFLQERGIHASLRTVGLVEADEGRFTIVLESSVEIATKAIGQVTGGLGHLTSKNILIRPINSLFIKDCGIILPMNFDLHT